MKCASCDKKSIQNSKALWICDISGRPTQVVAPGFTTALVVNIQHTSLVSELLFYHCDETLWPKPTSGGKSIFQLMTYRLSPREARAGAQGWNLETRNDAEAVEQGCFLAWSSHPVFLYHPGSSSQSATTHTRLGLPTSVISQENAQACSQASLVGHFLSRGSFFQNDAGLCQADIELTSTLSIMCATIPWSTREGCPKPLSSARVVPSSELQFSFTVRTKFRALTGTEWLPYDRRRHLLPCCHNPLACIRSVYFWIVLECLI